MIAKERMTSLGRLTLAADLLALVQEGEMTADEVRRWLKAGLLFDHVHDDDVGDVLRKFKRLAREVGR